MKLYEIEVKHLVLRFVRDKLCKSSDLHQIWLKIHLCIEGENGQIAQPVHQGYQNGLRFLLAVDSTFQDRVSLLFTNAYRQNFSAGGGGGSGSQQ